MLKLGHPANIGYTELTIQLASLAKRYPLEIKSIGTSLLGRQLWTVHLGQGTKSIYLSGAYHGNEWLTAAVLLQFISNYLETLEKGTLFWGIDLAQLSTQVSLWITPMVNPDGVTLVREGLNGIPSQYHSTLWRWNYGNTNFRYWKSNIRGVDLNRQFQADWRKAYLDGPKLPAPKYFAGENPESEPESRAVAQFTRELIPEIVVAYHSQGEVIYWNYRKKAPPTARRIARELSRLSGYALIGSNPQEAGSGGFKDWFIDNYQRPGFTIEIGRGINPLPLQQFGRIWRQNAPLLAHLGTFLR